MLQKILKIGSPVLSFLIGFGLAVLFFHKNYSVKHVLAMPVDKIENQIVRHEEKCYTYTSEDRICPAINKDGGLN